MLKDSIRCKKTEHGIPLSVFKEHFEKLSQAEGSDETLTGELQGSDFDGTCNSFINESFSVNEVIIQISKLKNNKASGLRN